MENISNALHTSFINKQLNSDNTYKTNLLYNDYKKGMKLSQEIIDSLKKCNSFCFSIAFISESGLAVLKQALIELEKRNVKGKIVTSTYLGFNTPKAFRELLKFSNITTHIYEKRNVGFHSKGYIFKYNDYYKTIIGSSNLTQSALSTNQEWNIGFTSYKDGEIIEQILDEFENQWSYSTPLTYEWIEEYEKTYSQPLKINEKNIIKEELSPNTMQKEALNSLENTRQSGENKALIVSATGTGKTYLSAFDVKKYNANKMLFIVHRKSIALASMESFKHVIPNKTMGLFSGDIREMDNDYIFATIQTIHKEKYLKLFAPATFDYIIIDEVHRAGADSYQQLLNYFKPKFLLGMSATPERSDGFDIYQLFDHNIAYEIRLNQAMEYDLLCPFHYYGITDLIIDNEAIDDKADFNTLTSDLRVNYILEQISKYGHSGDKVRGLIFCSRKNEAKQLSLLFNQKGFNTVALTGEDSEATRQEAMARLESEDDNLDYVFTVDIFNEGVDIPKINQIVMLRPTESAIVFVQQLGRGLRKTNSKEYVVIIDFIGNYEKNFLIPTALSGNTNYNKDDLRRFVSEGSLIIPGSSTIQFDEISKHKIYQSIDTANFNQIKIIKESYFELKNKIGHIPELYDFEFHGHISPLKIMEHNNLKCYHTFLRKYDKDYKVEFTDMEEKYLQFISSKFANGKRIHEIECIKNAIMDYTNFYDNFKRTLKITYDVTLTDLSYNSIQNILSQNFATGSSAKTFKDVPILTENFEVDPQFRKLLQNKEFKRQVLEVLDFSISEYYKNYAHRYKDTNLTLYQKYSYEDVLRLLNWEKNEVALNIGGYKYNQSTNTLPVFINYEKAEHIANTIKYEDHFIDQKTLIAMSKNKRTITSNDMQTIIHSKENKTQIHLFVRKNKDDSDSKEFYYLGQMYYKDILEKEKNNQSICEITYELDTAVRNDIYSYIVNENV